MGDDMEKEKVMDLIERDKAKMAVRFGVLSAATIYGRTDEGMTARKEIERAIDELPSAQPEPLSDAYMKAVWTWLLNYQIKAAELKGRYTPYEVLSWVANDWRKEHERFDKQTGGD